MLMRYTKSNLVAQRPKSATLNRSDKACTLQIPPPAPGALLHLMHSVSPSGVCVNDNVYMLQANCQIMCPRHVACEPAAKLHALQLWETLGNFGKRGSEEWQGSTVLDALGHG